MMADISAIAELTDPGADKIDVQAVLARLHPDHRVVLVLRYLEDMSEEDTAEFLAVEVGTVKSRTSRARESFARRWSP
jgi:RNA polymerase sigma factor (sigma-70 family)